MNFKEKAEMYARERGLTDPCIVSGELNGEKVYFTDRVGATRWKNNFDIGRDGGVFPSFGIAKYALKVSSDIYGDIDADILNQQIEKLDATPLPPTVYPYEILNH